ncbi:MAG: ATP-binding cassette domain-containing protein [Rhodospirillaceae bacterium]|nr:ATP-binding cassette domain-containing protein [Rhodospirillaceae bacterium]
MPTDPPVVSLRSVGVSYRSRGRLLGRAEEYWALSEVSFDVYPGETVGLIGKNGAGKTTLLKAIAGIIEADRGSIERDDVSLTMLSLQVGFLPQLSGRENAILSGMMLGLDRKAAEREVDSIEAFAELGDHFDAPLATYSNGMRARLGFSCALYSAAEVLLIDEVLGVGDQQFRVKSTDAIKSLIRSKRTVLLASHNLATVRELCDRVIWIENGRTRAAGTTAQVLEQYARD